MPETRRRKSRRRKTEQLSPKERLKEITASIEEGIKQLLTRISISST
jgi:hypothetical protein